VASSSGIPIDVVTYGPDVGSEDEFRLLGELKGKRVLELGCGSAQRCVAFARQGATAIGVDFSAAMIDAAKRVCEREGVRVELRQADLADLAFLRADSVDLVFSAYALPYVRDVERVFRQANRVLKAGSPLVFSLPHPALATVDDSEDGPPRVARSYFDRSPVTGQREGEPVDVYHHTTADLLTGLVHSGYRIDAVHEPEWASRGPQYHYGHESVRYMPRALVVRARKEGH
jgi:ubiquinone/menaquinone biosynthesis C-methylase UbiE